MSLSCKSAFNLQLKPLNYILPAFLHDKPPKNFTNNKIAIWNYTIQLYLRENPENAAPKGVLRDAAYLLYTAYKDIAFVSGDKWHKKFVDEVSLFKGVRENFTFVDPNNEAKISEGVSKLL